MTQGPINITGFDHLKEVEREMAKKTPADMLREIASIYDERKPMYGDNYKHVGKAMVALFPDGVHIPPGDAETWNRLHFVMHMYSKLSRYCMNLQRGGHQDSLDDLAVYAMLARECDEEEKDHG
jgi:hypothetical protein